MRRLMYGLTAAMLTVALSTAFADSKKASATIRLSGGSVAAGIGLSWGSGTLSYKGKAHPIDVKGLSIGDVGITKIEASGKVYNLQKLADFNGNYTAASAGATAAGGGSVTAMRNQNGVVIELVSTTQGVKLTLGGAGVDMKLKE